jgi:hypothetical protein
MSTQNDIQLIQHIITGLENNPVARFAYTQDAFDNDDVDGVDVFSVNAGQNIPKADKTDYNPTILEKGVRSQGASIPRMAWNHFIGRTSYNVNKLVKKVHSFIDVYRTSLAHNANEYDSFAAYRNGDICYTVEAVGMVKVYTWYQRKSSSPATISNIYPSVTLHWEEMQSKTSSSALLPLSASGYRHKVTVADLTGAQYDVNRWYPVTTGAQDFQAQVGGTKEGALRVLIEAYCNGTVAGYATPHRAELSILATFTGFPDSSTDILLGNAFVDQETGAVRDVSSGPIGFTKLVRGRQAVIWLRSGSIYALWNSFLSDFTLHTTQYANTLDDAIDVSAARPFTTPSSKCLWNI